MNPHYWTTFCLWLAIAGTSAQSGDTVMTWYIGSDDRNDTVQFTEETFAQFSRCVCIGTHTSCVVYTNDGVTSYINPGSSGSTQGYTNTYICERLSNSELIVGCLRLELSSCSDVNSYPFWSYTINSSPEPCGIGQVKITWISDQLFQMTYSNTSLTISKGSLTCSSPPVSARTTPLTTQSYLSTSKDSPCLPACATTPTTYMTTKEKKSKATQSSDDDDTGVIIGVVVAIVVCVVLVAVTLIVWWRKKKAQTAEKYGNSQLSSQSVAEQASQDNYNLAQVSAFTDVYYNTISADHSIVNGNNASYNNLKDNSNTSASAYENIVGSASVTPSGGNYRNLSHSGQIADGYEVPLPAINSQTLSQRHSNTSKNLVQGDGSEYEDLSELPIVCFQTSTDYVNQLYPTSSK